VTTASRLPPTVRTRVIGLAADALSTMPADEVPASLRQVARFAPRKRASTAAGPIAAALEDERFRASVSAVVRSAVGELATAVGSGQAPATADPVDVAALLWLLRPEGWEDALAASLESVAAASSHDAQRESAATVARLEADLTAERDLRRTETAALREQLTAARSELDRSGKEIRRAADRAQRAEAAARSVDAQVAAARVEAERQVTELEAEVRRLRQRLVEAEAAATTGKAAARRDREGDTMRLRLLLDSLLGAAQGLRRELALPPSDQRPGDLVEGGRDAASEALTAQGRSPDDPAFLDRLLTVPGIHMIIDGYNVTKTGYGGLSLEMQRDRLLAAVAGLAARTGAEVTVVFDGAERGTVAPSAAPRGVRVRFSDPGVIADELIARFVAEEPPGRPLVVVSTDGEVAAHARSASAYSVPSIALVRLLDRS
jgi:predicted RNA-binding protein with PIN domain